MKKGAKWIACPKNVGNAAVTFCNSFHPQKTVKRATLYATAMGIYAFYLNGERIGKGVLTPGWTSYAHRVQYQTYELTPLLRADNRLEFGVAPGWAVGCIGYGHTNHFFADHPSLIARLEVLYADGTSERLVTDESWQVYSSHVLSSEIYHGETVDLTAPIELLGNAVLSRVSTRLVPQVGEWITEQERLAPVQILRTPKGERVIDFGQNMTGYVEVRARGQRGERIVLHHAEILDSEGNFYNENYRQARNENVYVLSGGEDLFKPTYCFQGFRYVRLTEYPRDPIDPADFCAVAVHSELTRTGEYRCGNSKINQLYHNILWGQKSNYLDLPTDCPQRDERLGWTGDAQIFYRAAAFNYDVERFFEKWLGDVALEQGEDGSVAGIVPHCLPGKRTRVSAAWGDVATVVPWGLYVTYGSRRLLKKHFPMMKKWVDYIHSAGPEEFLWLGGRHYGDWLAMDNDPDKNDGATPTDYIASVFFYYSTRLLVKAGRILGEDVEEYRTLVGRILEAIRARYVKNGDLRLLPNGWKEGDEEPTLKTQTAYVLALYFGICQGEEKQCFAKRLAEMIRENGTRMTTGFVGTPYLLHALSQNGYTDLAYELLLQEKSPSWLYSVCHGATTMWEHWNSLKEDGSFWSTSMNSFNHYAYGAVLDWMVEVSAGIAPLEAKPAYREVLLAPHPHPALGFSDVRLQTRHGAVRSHWYYKGERIYYEFEIPRGVTGHVRLPSGYRAELGEGRYCFAE